MFASASATPAGKAITLKSRDEIEIMAEANRIVAEVLSILQRTVEPGITTYDLDRIAEEHCQKRNAVPAFKGYRGFPGSLCVSVNEEVVHGIPSRKRKLRKGDIVSVDFGTFYKGYYGDSAITIAVGRIDALKQKLLRVTEESLTKAIEQVQIGNRVVDIAAAVQDHVERNGFSVVRQFVGHGIGTELHEGPEIPNFVQEGTSPRLQEGMVLAIEPMVNIGTHQVKVLRDGWTVITADKKPSAHFEHSVAVTGDGPLILSSRDGIT
ncbi:type I methionyl aminopeptidase [Desulfofustis limnaeus]|uniref:Methionine aminopeptidase n=1 Tax=Desulfofustis limnaeus TaxID=2740163 RepID=A0ABM7W5H0_9BACT|nr:type I methionyl aminopeptidase [Desulfofustis limnaeus]MDX9895825.1 type I methionyl aminopeptidase [Desulfofustis sp.]BDD86152.1 type I methionyl aminopeptidase [Desulfofustis limnaeus]